MRSSSGLLAAALLFLAVPTLAQSTDSTPPPTLADLAKKAQEQKDQKDKKAAQEQKDQKDQKKKGSTPAIKTFTNDDLKSVSTPTSDDSTNAKSDTKDSDKSGDAAKNDVKKDDPAKGDPTKTEKYWRDRMDGAREDVRRNQAFAAALQSRINGLTADFSARDDPYQRAQIADERQKALAELDRVNKAVEDGNKAIAAIEEDARKAQVPAGWIR